MISPRFDVPASAGAGIPRHCLMLAAIVAIAGTALPVRAQRPLGSFPESRWEQLDHRAADENVLPFVEGEGGELADSSGEPSNPAESENPWMESAAPEAPILEDAPVDRPASDEIEPKADAPPVKQPALPAEPAIMPPIPEETALEAPTPAEPAAQMPSIPEPATPSTPPMEKSHSAAREPIPDRKAEGNPAPAEESSDGISTTDAAEDTIVLAGGETAEAVASAAPAPLPTAATTAPAAIAGKTTSQAKSSDDDLHNPFTPDNILQWVLYHGPRLLAILVGMFVLQFVAKLFSLRIVSVLARGGARGTREEREDRAQTLVGVFHNAASLVIVVGSIVMACEEVGIAIGPLVGGAAVLGLAAAFGAQNLIRDYFYGFMILLENQYKIHDIVKIGGVSGEVERITMRITVLRDLEGNVHFVPNGKIETVTNMSHGWSCALVEIRIAYQEDVDRVMRLLMELAGELRQDPEFGPLILDDAQMLGVDSLGDSAVNIKFVIKTRPLKQWAVRRELLRRIKRRFEELKIEIPYPHRTVLHRSAGTGAGEIKGSSTRWDADRAA